MKFLLNAAALVVIAFVLLRLFFMESVIIQDNGMAPTLVYGDEVLVWVGAHADMSDVMVCEHPVRDGVLVTGRAVAFAGHRISTDRMGTLYVDDDRSTDQVEGSVRFYDVTRKKQWDMQLRRIDYFGRHDHAYFMEKGGTFHVPAYAVEKGIYLLGDNRSETQFDSRAFGEVNPERCLGQVIMRLRPAPSRGDELEHGYLDVIE